MDNYGLIRVGAAVPQCQVANPSYNAKEIVRLVKEADRNGVEVLVFPELCITAYTCEDLFFTSSLQQGAEQALTYILEETKALSTISILGMPVWDGQHLYNCGVVVQRGRILGVVPKTYLPNHGEFYEGRWFYSAAQRTGDTVTLAGQTAPFHTELIFHTNHVNFAVEICEDLWVSTPPSSLHTLNGAEVIFNPSASNAVVGKQSYRTMLAKQRSFSSSCGYVLTSAGIGESTTDTVFSGHVTVAETGSVLLNQTHMAFESKLFYTEIDVERIRNNRMRSTTDITTLPRQQYTVVPIGNCSAFTGKPARTFSQYPFVPQAADKDERMNEIVSILSAALAKRLQHTGVTHPVIGISGGLDSTLALLIVAKAMDMLSLPHSDIVAVTMPGFGTSGRTYENAKKLMELLEVTVREISIKDACIQHFKDIGHDIANTDVTYENSQARERTQILMDIANQQKGLVIGTGDLSELALGWATYAGDHISMYCVNSGVPKTLVRHLVAWMGEHSGDEQLNATLKDIIDTPVSPELLPADGQNGIAQKTEEILGDYALHDFFLYYFVRCGFAPAKIQYLAEQAFEGTYPPEEIRRCLKLFFKRFFSNQFKRSCLPDGPKIGSVTLSPRADFRMPSDASVTLWLEEMKHD